MFKCTNPIYHVLKLAIFITHSICSSTYHLKLKGTMTLCPVRRICLPQKSRLTCDTPRSSDSWLPKPPCEKEELAATSANRIASREHICSGMHSHYAHSWTWFLLTKGNSCSNNFGTYFFTNPLAGLLYRVYLLIVLLEVFLMLSGRQIVVKCECCQYHFSIYRHR